MNAYNEILDFLMNRAKFAEYREDYWGFVEDASMRHKLFVVTDGDSMRREYQYHYPVKAFFGFREKTEVVALDRTDVSTLEWYRLEDALYYACGNAKEQ
jgi:hypothetical protein